MLLRYWVNLSLSNQDKYKFDENEYSKHESKENTKKEEKMLNIVVNNPNLEEWNNLFSWVA